MFSHTHTIGERALMFGEACVNDASSECGVQRVKSERRAAAGRSCTCNRAGENKASKFSLHALFYKGTKSGQSDGGNIIVQSFQGISFRISGAQDGEAI